MSIFRRKDAKTKDAVWWYDFTVKGERRRGSTKTTVKHKARAFEADLLAEARKNGIHAMDMMLRDAPILKDFAADFLKWVEETHSIESETKRGYRQGWRLLSTTKLASLRMDAIGNHDCETTAFPGSNFNANRALSTLRRMFSKAKELRRVHEVPNIELRKVQGRSIAMSIADAALIASHMPAGHAKDAFLILRATGMRPSEAFRMEWQYVDWQERCYRNPNGKTKSARRAVPLLGDSLEILRRRHAKGTPTQGWVFPSKRSKSGHVVTIQKVFVEARNAAGLPNGMVLYTARHGQMGNLGQVLSTKEVMEIGGHTDTRVAMSYQHVNVAAVQAKLDEAKTNGRIM